MDAPKLLWIERKNFTLGKQIYTSLTLAPTFFRTFPCVLRTFALEFFFSNVEYVILNQAPTF